ncbi:MAG TPA: hypothetical protein VHC47_15275 [Mucilaginibacter sp.]|nr:hypothetical protein [Mucilaginibacter sp.]
MRSLCIHFDIEAIVLLGSSAARPSNENGKTMPDSVAAGGKQVLQSKTFAYLVLPFCRQGWCDQEGIGADLTFAALCVKTKCESLSGD